MKVKIDGFDPYSDTIIKHITIWKDLNQQEISFVVKHGKKVKLLVVDDEWAMVSRFGKQGYVKTDYIQGLKADFVEKIYKERGIEV